MLFRISVNDNRDKIQPVVFNGNQISYSRRAPLCILFTAVFGPCIQFSYYLKINYAVSVFDVSIFYLFVPYCVPF